MGDRPVAAHTYPEWGPRFWQQWTLTQVAFTVVVVAVAVVLTIAGQFLAAVLLVVLAAALVPTPEPGLAIFDKVGIGLGYLWRRTRRRTAWKRDGSGQPVRWLSGTEVHEFAVAGGAIGLIERHGQWIAGVRVAPLRNPALLSAEALDVQAERWAQLLTAIPNELVDRVQVLTVTRTGGGDALVTDAEQATGPGGDVTRQVAAELAAQMRHTDTVLMMRLSRPTGQDLHTRGGTAAVGAMLYQVITRAVRNLGLDELMVELLGKSDITALVTRILHPADAAAALLSPPDTVDVVDSCTERFTSLEVDGAQHRVMWLWQWPQRPVPAGWLHPILTGRQRVVSLVLSIEDRSTYARKLDGEFRRADVSLATSTYGQHRKRAQRDAVDARLQELTAGHVPVRAQITIGVTGNTAEAVAETTADARTEAGPAHSRVVAWEGRQERAVSWILPFCEGLGGGVNT